MADEDVKTMVREFRSSVSAELSAMNRNIEEFKDELRSRLTMTETAILNEIRDLSRRVDRRFERVDGRLDALEHGSGATPTAG